MQANIWCDLGIGFPALKAILKGVKSGFKTIKGDHTEDLKHFGDKEDNYPYFNRLVSHIYKNKNAAPFILVSLRSSYLLQVVVSVLFADGYNHSELPEKLHKLLCLVLNTTKMSQKQFYNVNQVHRGFTHQTYRSIILQFEYHRALDLHDQRSFIS